jgi:hypothetical protein
MNYSGLSVARVGTLENSIRSVVERGVWKAKGFACSWPCAQLSTTYVQTYIQAWLASRLLMMIPLDSVCIFPIVCRLCRFESSGLRVQLAFMPSLPSPNFTHLDI